MQKSPHPPARLSSTASSSSTIGSSAAPLSSPWQRAKRQPWPALHPSVNCIQWLIHQQAVPPRGFRAPRRFPSPCRPRQTKSGRDGFVVLRSALAAHANAPGHPPRVCTHCEGHIALDGNPKPLRPSAPPSKSARHKSPPNRRARASACGTRPRPKKIRCASLRAGLLTQTQCHPRLPNPQRISGCASAQRRASSTQQRSCRGVAPRSLFIRPSRTPTESQSKVQYSTPEWENQDAARKSKAIAALDTQSPVRPRLIPRLL